MQKRQLFLDTETTGLKANEGDRIIEIAALEMVDRKLTGNNLVLRLCPEGKSIHPDASAVHGIFDDDLKNCPTFAQKAQEIFDFLDHSILIIHNAPFDIGFLEAEFARIKMPMPQVGVIDTLHMARNKFPGAPTKLDALCTRFKIDKSKRTFHGALIDCELLCEVYFALTIEQNELDFDTPSGETPMGIGADYPVNQKPSRVILPSEDEITRWNTYQIRLNDELIKLQSGVAQDLIDKVITWVETAQQIAPDVATKNDCSSFVQSVIQEKNAFKALFRREPEASASEKSTQTVQLLHSAQPLAQRIMSMQPAILEEAKAQTPPVDESAKKVWQTHLDAFEKEVPQMPHNIATLAHSIEEGLTLWYKRKNK